MVCSAAIAETAPPLAACLVGPGDLPGLLEELADTGWRPITVPDETCITRLAWIGTAHYLATDSGGESLSRLLEINRRSAAGLTRKLDTPASRTRLLRRGNDVLVVIATKQAFLCRAATGTAERDAAPAIEVSHSRSDGTRITRTRLGPERLGAPQGWNVPAEVVEIERARVGD